MTFEEKSGHTNLNPEIIHLCIMDIIRNDWKHILRNEDSQKSLLKMFASNNQGAKNKSLPQTFQ